MAPRDLVERTRLFALAVLKFCRSAPPDSQDEIRQLRRAANSVRANYRAARRGRSRAEFQAKLGIVFEEADECVDSLKYFRDARIKHDADLIQEARELASIFAQALKTTRANSERMKDLPGHDRSSRG